MTTTKPEKTAIKNAISLNREIVNASMDINNVLTTSKKVSPLLHAHYTNMENGKNGIAALIIEILTANDAVFPASYDETLKSHYNNHEMRNIIIASSMFTRDILNEVENRFTAGSCRYPLKTVETYLSVFMVRKSIIGKLKLSKNEDKENRPKDWSKPRAKWFAIES
jgi:hypothetical protein